MGLVYTQYLVIDENGWIKGEGQRSRIPYSQERILDRPNTRHDLEGYAIAATKNQVFEAILIMMLRSLQAISRAFFMINLPSRVSQLLYQAIAQREVNLSDGTNESIGEAAQSKKSY